MQDPSFSEMALNAAFESINAAQKSLEKGLNQSNGSLSDLSKRGNQKSNLSFKDLGLADIQKEEYSKLADAHSERISLADLSESQKPYSENDQHTLSPRELSVKNLDQESKSLMALQIAADAIANALASQEELSKKKDQADAKRFNPVNTPLLQEKKKILQDKKAITDAKIKQASKITPADVKSKKSRLDNKKKHRDDKIKQLSSIKSPDLQLRKSLLKKKEDVNPQEELSVKNLDQESKSLMALQIATDAIANALASQEELSKKKDQADSKRFNPVNTPLLQEKKKILQDKKAITDAKIKQASKITPADVKSKKSRLDNKKKHRDYKIKQLSSIKSPDLQLRKSLLKKKEDVNLQEADSIARKESLLALNLALEAVNYAQQTVAAESPCSSGNEKIQAQNAENIQDLQYETEALENAQKSDEKIKANPKSDFGNHSADEAVNSALSEAHKSLEILKNILVQNQEQKTEEQLQVRSEADLIAIDLAATAIFDAEKSINELSNALSKTYQSTNVNSLEKTGVLNSEKKKSNLIKNQHKSPEKKEKVQKKGSPEKKKILPKFDKMKQAIMDQFTKIKSPNSSNPKKRDEKKENKKNTESSAPQQDKNDFEKISKSVHSPKKTSAVKEKEMIQGNTQISQKVEEYKHDFETTSCHSELNTVQNSEDVRVNKFPAAELENNSNLQFVTGKNIIGGKKEEEPATEIPLASSKIKEQAREYEAKASRTLLSRQKKKFQIKIGRLKHRIKLLKYQRNSQLDPSIEAKYFPQLARIPYLKSSIGVIPSRVTDSFALNSSSWNDGLERPKTAPRQRSNNEILGGDVIAIFNKRPHTALPPNTQDLVIGARVCVLLNGQRCLGWLKYLGKFDPYDDKWCGIELDRPLGTHNGVFKNIRYFECPESHGLFVKSERLIPLRSKN